MKVVKLHNLQVSDAQLFADLANDSRISQNTSDRFPHPYTLSDAETFIRQFSSQVVVGHVFGSNLVSQHVLKKNGFTCLGTIPNGAFKLGKYEDNVVFFKENPNH
jgi:hypothetical protein